MASLVPAGWVAAEEAAMIAHTTVLAMGQARLADLHDQARRDALVRAVRRARRAAGRGARREFSDGGPLPADREG